MQIADYVHADLISLELEIDVTELFGARVGVELVRYEIVMSDDVRRQVGQVAVCKGLLWRFHRFLEERVAHGPVVAVVLPGLGAFSDEEIGAHTAVQEVPGVALDNQRDQRGDEAEGIEEKLAREEVDARSPRKERPREEEEKEKE